MMYTQRITDPGDKCDKCHKPASEARPMLAIQVVGRSWHDRQFVQIHFDCLAKLSEVKP